MMDAGGQYPVEEPNGGWVSLATVIAVALVMLLAWCVAAVSDDKCPYETQETRITEKILPGVDHVWIFTDGALNTFLQGLRENGLMIGVPITDKVYVTLDHYYFVFFLNKGCIVHYGRAPLSVMQRILPK